ncbi:MAG: RHS repeat-associated core domain-containing protein, partial [Brevundimonas sp.]|uniref:RHS repeat-associated core domain-containing protein n=1 Tax=Brevundimonas sp. TaxID=1871086 RepID=UPI00273432EC
MFRTYQNDRIPVANAEVTLGTVDGTPLALNAVTGAEGTVQWSLPVQSYTVRARYLGRIYHSDAFTSGDPDVLIPEGLARVTLRQGGAALPNTHVTAISDTDPDHPRNLTTDASGEAIFRLPAGSYTFKATLGETVHQGVGTVVADQITDITLNLGTSTLAITVRKDGATVLPGVICSLFTPEGEPLGRSATTDASGVASFAVEAGTYVVKARYLEQDFATDPIGTPAVLSASLTIPHRDLAIRIVKDQGMGAEPVVGIRCYLYSSGDNDDITATGLFADSDDQGMVHFLVPRERGYFGVVTLLGRDFISMEGEDLATLTIELGTMTVTVRDDSLVSEGNSEGRVPDAVVELFTAEGAPLGQELSTETDGQVCFTLPEGNYTLRIGYNDQQFWSNIIHTSPFGDTPVDMVNGYGGVMSRLHNPQSPLWHGTPPEYRPHLALASGSLAGMLTATSTPIADTPQVFYYLNDHLGTAQLIVDDTRTVVWQGDTQPFGQVTEVINQLDHRFRFPGQMVDPESGLHYNWNRFYDPGTGRYLSP